MLVWINLSDGSKIYCQKNKVSAQKRQMCKKLYKVSHIPPLSSDYALALALTFVINEGIVSDKSGYRSLIVTQVVNKSSTDQHTPHLPQNSMLLYPKDFPIRADFAGGPAARSSNTLS